MSVVRCSLARGRRRLVSSAQSWFDHPAPVLPSISADLCHHLCPPPLQADTNHAILADSATLVSFSSLRLGSNDPCQTWRAPGRPVDLSSQQFGQLKWKRRLWSAAGGEGRKDAEGEEQSGSWLDRLKGVFSGKKGDEKADEKAEGLTLEQFADQLKRVRRFGSLSQFGRGLPRGGEEVAARSLERQEQIIRAMTPEEQANLDQFGDEARARVAKQCLCSVADVSSVIEKFVWFREANAKLENLKKEGKPLPKTLEEVEQLMGRGWSSSASRSLAGTPGQGPSRNAACPCGSGKKYKRCCGVPEAA